MSHIISFVSQKGGVGKSTLTRATAIELIKNKCSVNIMDLDIQQTTTLNWHKMRKENKIKPVLNAVSSFSNLKEVKKIDFENFDFTIIDAPARSSIETFEIAKISTLIIQPSGASIDDLEPAILLFHELTERNIDKNKLFIALSRISTHSEAKEAQRYIKEAGYNTLDGFLFEKASYRQAQNEGKTILETRYVNLKKKADVLIQSIFNNFERTF
jgi:chromosome partitioning protein